METYHKKIMPCAIPCKSAWQDEKNGQDMRMHFSVSNVTLFLVCGNCGQENPPYWNKKAVAKVHNRIMTERN